MEIIKVICMFIIGIGSAVIGIKMIKDNLKRQV